MKKEWGELMFKLVSDYKPTGDQPKAIEYLSKGIEEGKKFQTLLSFFAFSIITSGITLYCFNL